MMKITKDDDGRGPGRYRVVLNSRDLGTVAKVRERTPVLTNDHGLTYQIGVTERTRWAATTPGGRQLPLYPTRGDAVNHLVQSDLNGFVYGR